MDIRKIMQLLFINTVIIALTYLYGFFTNKLKYWERRGIPCRKLHLKPNIHPGQQAKQWYDIEKGKFPFLGMYIFADPFALILDLNLIRSILIKDFQYFNDRGIYYNEKDDPLSAHLFALDGEKWKKLRYKLTPTFTSSKIKSMFFILIQVCEELEKTLRELIKKNDIIDMKELLSCFTTDVICACVLGIDCNTLKDSNLEFRRMGKLMVEQPRNYAFLITFKKIAQIFRLTNTKKDVSKFMLNIVKQTIDYRIKHNVKRNDFMDLLIQLGKYGKLDENEYVGHLTFEEIAAQAYIFFVGGFETSASTLSFSLYELAINQDVQEKLRNEINNVIEKHNGEFTYQAMMEMTYLDQVINETLRKYPPASILFRKAQQDYQVPGTDIVIEKEIMVSIPVYAIHYDPEYYPNPLKFDPERFSSENVNLRPRCTFLPFGEGPRNCIGLRFGMMNVRLGLVTLLRNFRIKACDKTSIPLSFEPEEMVLTPVGGNWLKIENL